MDSLGVLILLGLCIGIRGQFDPGCSFSNGQCIYNVKLGHEQHCDVASGKRDTVSSGTSSGFQSCSCKDIDAVSHSVDSLFSSMSTLQRNFDQLATKLNATQEQLGMKTNQVSSLLSANTNLTAKLTNTEMLLNKSKVDLVNTIANMNKDLDSLRQQITGTNNELKLCQAGLNIHGSQTSNPGTGVMRKWALGNFQKVLILTSNCVRDAFIVLYSNFVTHYCDFEASNFCNYTVSTCTGSDTECWYHGSGRQNQMSGPVEDHTFGSPRGHYMYIDPYKHAHYTSSSATSAPTRKARITSPEFPPSSNYCIRFWYTMFGKDVKTMKVYARVGSGDGYPIYSLTGQEDKYWHMAEVPLTSEYTASPFKIVIEATTDSRYYRDYHSSSSQIYRNAYGYIAFDDVFVYNTTCSGIPTHTAGSRKMTFDNETSYYTFHVTTMSWYDAVEMCKKEAPNGHLVSINSKKEQEFLVDTIQNNAVYTAAGARGWYTSGNDERTEGNFKWTDTGYPFALNYTDWTQGQPNNVGNVQNCLLMENAADYFTWGDVNCADKHPFICEIKM